MRDANGTERISRVAFAGHNEQPFESVARALLERGELRDASWPALSDWARRNPAKVREALAVNPRVVYFREEALADAAQGPRGAQGVQLTPGRSVAVDRAFIALGTPLWLDSTEPLSPTPLRRLVLAQDTGAAIQGAARADLFWGWGDDAALLAGRTKQPLRLWALWPAGVTP
jgi:membrane-bound lytic murein transglycosylase A